MTITERGFEDAITASLVDSAMSGREDGVAVIPIGAPNA